MSFSFNAVELCIVTINKKPWTRTKEACRVLEYGKATRTAHIIKAHVSPENYTQKYQMSSVLTATTPINMPKESQKYDIYINQEGMYELVFGSQQPKAKDFRRHCCNVMFPRIQQQLTNKMKEDHQQAVEEKDNQMQALESKNEEH